MERIQQSKLRPSLLLLWKAKRVRGVVSGRVGVNRERRVVRLAVY